jgi:hypothetical protein
VSLAKCLEAGTFALYYTCSTVDTYASIWTGILEEAEVVSLRYKTGFGSGYESVLQSAAKLFRGEDPTPNSVRQVLQTLASSSQLPVVVVVDEFDRIETSGTRRLFADTIKILSDQAILATLVLVGAGDTIDELIVEHASVQRSLLQIRMPRMSDEEITQIIRNGMDAAGLQVERGFVREVINLSQGLPHYAHLMSQHAAIGALLGGRSLVRKSDFTWA